MAFRGTATRNLHGQRPLTFRVCLETGGRDCQIARSEVLERCAGRRRRKKNYRAGFYCEGVKVELWHWNSARRVGNEFKFRVKIIETCVVVRAGVAIYSIHMGEYFCDIVNRCGGDI